MQARGSCSWVSLEGEQRGGAVAVELAAAHTLDAATSPHSRQQARPSRLKTVLLWCQVDASATWRISPPARPSTALQSHVQSHLNTGAALENTAQAYLPNLAVQAAIYQSHTSGRRVVMADFDPAHP